VDEKEKEAFHKRLKLLSHEFQRGQKEMFEKMRPFLCFAKCTDRLKNQRELTFEEFVGRKK